LDLKYEFVVLTGIVMSLQARIARHILTL